MSDEDVEAMLRLAEPGTTHHQIRIRLETERYDAAVEAYQGYLRSTATIVYHPEFSWIMRDLQKTVDSAATK